MYKGNQKLEIKGQTIVLSVLRLKLLIALIHCIVCPSIKAFDCPYTLHCLSCDLNLLVAPLVNQKLKIKGQTIDDAKGTICFNSKDRQLMIPKEQSEALNRTTDN
jgi:hypothetical protein